MTRNSFNLSRKSNLNEAARNLYKFFRSIKKKGYKKKEAREGVTINFLLTRVLAPGSSVLMESRHPRVQC